MFTLYILYSSQLDRFYIGFTGEPVEARLQKHLANHSGFTGKAKDWKIVYKETHSTKAEAMQREKLLKSGKSKERIKALIASSSTE